MKSSFSTLDNGNLEIKLTISWPEVKKAYEKEVDAAVANSEISGFRKGKAPKNIVLPKLNKDDLYSHAIQKLVPTAYSDALKEQALKPILHPHLTLQKGEEGSDWEFIAVTCESPKVTISDNFADAIKKVKVEKDGSKLEAILAHLQKTYPVKIPDILVEEESNHRITSLVDNITRVGLTTENYLASKKLTPEDFKSQTASQSRTDLEIEFILNEIAKKKSFKDRKSTLDFLTSLV
jgi:trigger factor